MNAATNFLYRQITHIGRGVTLAQGLKMRLSGGFVSAEDLAVNFDLSVPVVNMALQEASRKDQSLKNSF